MRVVEMSIKNITKQKLSLLTVRGKQDGVLNTMTYEEDPSIKNIEVSFDHIINQTGVGY